MKTGIKQRQFVEHGDYSITANCPTKKKSRIPLGTSGIFRGISVFLFYFIFFLRFFPRTLVWKHCPKHHLNEWSLK
jgi:hypothetical protein